jgi:chromosome segregation ATPase
MKKTLIVMLGIIIIVLVVLSFWGRINFIEIKEKVDSVKNNLTLTRDSLKITIQNINEVRKDINLAKKTIEQANKDLEQLSNNLNKELNNMKTNIKVLEEKRTLVDGKIAKIKNNIPGQLKILREPEYKKLGADK